MKLFTFLMLFPVALLGQELSDPATETFSAEALQGDFDGLVQAIEEIHPATYRFISPDSMSGIVSGYRSQINDSMTSEAFFEIVSRYIAELKCGHTSIIPSTEWYTYQRAESKMIPFEVWVQDSELFIRDAWDDSVSINPGAKLLSIDQKPAEDILAEMVAMQERDGFTMTFVTTKIQRLFRTYYLFLYGRQDTYEVAYRNPDGTERTVTVTGGVKKPRAGSAGAPPRLGEIKTSTATFYLSEEFDGLAILDLNSFPRQGFRQFYEEVFASIEENGIEHLVLDLRNNGGGYFPNGNNLLAYFQEEEVVMKFARKTNKVPKIEGLTMDFASKMTAAAFNLMPDKDDTDTLRNHELTFKPKKKNPYRGKLYVLIDGGTFSMGSLVATQLKHHSDAILIGQETGGGEEGSNAILSYTLTLPATGLRAFIPRYVLDHDVEVTQTGRGVMPEIPVSYSLQERMDGLDKELERVKGLVKGE